LKFSNWSSQFHSFVSLLSAPTGEHTSHAIAVRCSLYILMQLISSRPPKRILSNSSERSLNPVDGHKQDSCWPPDAIQDKATITHTHTHTHTQVSVMISGTSSICSAVRNSLACWHRRIVLYSLDLLYEENVIRTRSFTLEGRIRCIPHCRKSSLILQSSLYHLMNRSYVPGCLLKIPCSYMIRLCMQICTTSTCTLIIAPTPARLSVPYQPTICPSHHHIPIEFTLDSQTSEGMSSSQPILCVGTLPL
jgi:hypothetical protein